MIESLHSLFTVHSYCSAVMWIFVCYFIWLSPVWCNSVDLFASSCGVCLLLDVCVCLLLDVCVCCLVCVVGLQAQLRHSSGTQLQEQQERVGLLQRRSRRRPARVCWLAVWTLLLLGGEPWGGHLVRVFIFFFTFFNYIVLRGKSEES